MSNDLLYQEAQQIVAVNSPSHLKLVIDNRPLGREILNQAWEKYGMSKDLAEAQQMVINEIEFANAYEVLGLLEELLSVYQRMGNDMRVESLKQYIESCVAEINALSIKMKPRGL